MRVIETGDFFFFYDSSNSSYSDAFQAIKKKIYCKMNKKIHGAK